MKRKTLIASLLVMALAVCGGAGIGPAYEKMLDLRYRFQLLERRADSLGEVQAAALIHHQAARGDARFEVPPATSAAPGNWALIGGNGVAGSWPGGHFLKAKAMAVQGDDLYCPSGPPPPPAPP